MKPEKIKAFDALGKYILRDNTSLQEVIHQAYLHNKLFTEDNIRYALKAIAENFLQENLLQQWLSNYQLTKNNEQRTTKRIALIMAGNIPLAGFHDLLCVLLSGNFAMIKMSSKDKHLLPHLMDTLCEIEPLFKDSFSFVDMLKDFDAIIATGSNNSGRHFEFYFGKYPHIIRKNRNSVAVLSGKETPEQLQQLGNDIFLYFGLGCRSVSKLYVPKGYDFSILFKALEPFHPIINHHGYKSNFDYNLTLLIMNRTPYHASDFLMLAENKSLSSPIASLFFEYYDTLDEATAMIAAHRDDIQCIVAECGIPDATPFGKSQQPQLMDYADGVDTLQWLLNLQ